MIASDAAAQDLVVSIVDPQDAVVVGAQATVVCEGRPPVVARADGRGRVVLPDRKGCELTVDAAGFARWQGSIDEVRATAQVKLSVAPIEQRVVVKAPAESLPWAPLASAQLSHQDMALAGWDSMLALRYAKARAGATLRDDRVYVDGLPAAELPPASMIGELSVNADPFSVLYSESDQNVIDIISATPDRKFRWGGSLVPGKVGGRNPLGSHMSAERRSAAFNGSGPVPLTPVTFAVDFNGARSREERPVFSSPDSPPEPATSRGSGQTFAVGLVGVWGPRIRTRFTVASARGDADAVNSGGFVRPEAALSNSLVSHDLRFALEASGERYHYRTGLVYTTADSSFRAEAFGTSLLVLDALTAGGASMRTMTFGRQSWLWNNVVASTDSSWMGGWSVTTERTTEDLEPNPNGQLMFGSPQEYAAALQGLGGGVWTRIVGSARQTLRSTTGAVFGQREWRVVQNAVIRAGARLDYQNGDGVAVSPRVSARGTLRGLILQSGIGVFRQNWSNDVLMQARRFGSSAAERLISGIPARTIIADDFRRPLSLVMRNGAEVRGQRLASGLEYTWTAGIDRPGSRRLAAGEGWVDRLESSRRLRRHQLHARLEYSISGASIVGHYEWLLSHDNGDSAFSFPERQDDIDREWAPSTGTSPHNVSIVGTLPTLGGLSAGLVFTARSKAPLDILTGRDLDGTHLYLDRGGRQRNAGRGPVYQSLDGYAYRRVPIPFVKRGGTEVFIDATLSAENLLGVENDAAVGLVLASPFYGKAVSAQPGRTLRVSFRLGH